MSKTAFRGIALASVMLLNSVLLPLTTGEALADSMASKAQLDYQHVSLNSSREEGAGGFVLRQVDGEVVCNEATQEEAQTLFKRDPNLPLSPIARGFEEGVAPQEVGLKIILRATPQLDSFPQAKAAFLRAAANWEMRIRTPITIIIDVDFGTTRFGQPFPDPSTVGLANGQHVFSTVIYPSVRSRLIAGAISQQEMALYNNLPRALVPTDLGSTGGVSGPTPVFRALGLLNPAADPSTEPNLGPAPSIGFNSAIPFDFDPDGGIGSNQIDFDAAATHEIGHVLGFSSNLGSTFFFSTVSPLDVFRLRPGETLASFAAAQRILTPGGEQIFFTGSGTPLAFSTGAPDGSGGDGRQASHWKDDDLTGNYLGIMDPTLDGGERQTVTDNDLLAFDLIGYTLMTSGLPPPPPADPNTVPLNSGVARAGQIPAPAPGSGLLGPVQYTIQVSDQARELRIELDGNPDVDLLVRFGQRIVIQGGQAVADHTSESLTGSETITITQASTPPLRPGTYFIAVGNFGPGAGNFTVRATVIGGNNPPILNTLAAGLLGDVLTLTGTATDADGDIAQAQSSLLNSSGGVIVQSNPFAVDFGASTSVSFTLRLSNLKDYPEAMRASLVLIDARGNRSSALVADFSQADPGGPNISNVTYNGSKMVIKGSGLLGDVQVEINGLVVATGSSASDRKLKVRGSEATLNLRPGANRVRVLVGGRRSNIFVLRGEIVPLTGLRQGSRAAKDSSGRLERLARLDRL